MLIVPGRPAPTALTWWILTDRGEDPVVVTAGTAQLVRLARPGDPDAARRCFLVFVRGLDPDTPYELRARTASGDGDSARSRTLPIGKRKATSFTIALGSCYSVAQDEGLRTSYPPKAHDRDSGDPIRMRILCGDQIYMDLAPTSGGPLIFSGRPDPWSRYPEQWMTDGKSHAFLPASPTIVMADDHEFWNDYPHGNAHLFWDTPPAEDMERAFEVFQAALNLDPERPWTDAGVQAALGSEARTFELDLGPLPILMLDTRTKRTRYDAAEPHFTDPRWLQRAIDWIGNLRGPGALVLSQPFVEGRVSFLRRTLHTMGDVNLPDYDDDYAALCDAIDAAPHQLMILSGDIHVSRLAFVASKRRSDQVYEVISSALAEILDPREVVGFRGGASREGGEIGWRPERDVQWLKLKIAWKYRMQRSWTNVWADNPRQTYATITFRPQADAVGAPVDVEAAFWAHSSDPNQRARLLDDRTFTFTLS
jgi:hypothetical protein